MKYEEFKILYEDESFTESHHCDFKRKYKEDDIFELAKDITSFGNADGGRIYIGINNNKDFSNDETEFPVKKWETIDTEKLTCGTRGKLSNYLSHPIDFKVERIFIPKISKPIIYIDIRPSKFLLGCRENTGKPFLFFNRVDRENLPLTYAQIISKANGSDTYINKLKLSKAFSKIISRQLMKICTYIHLSYSDTKNEIKISNSIPENKKDKINDQKIVVVLECEKMHFHLAGLAFLAANILDELKEFCILLLADLDGIISDFSIWKMSISDIKKTISSDFFCTKTSLLSESNTLIDKYNKLLLISQEIEEILNQSGNEW
jgi:predicted HTH transcriptional regulator